MKTKVFIVGSIFIFTAIIFIVKLFSIQIVETRYKLSAANNTLRQETQYPSRGLIYDRDGNIMVSNKAYYDLKVVPKSLGGFDTVNFSKLINITSEELKEKINTSKSSYEPVIIKKQIEAEEYAFIQEQLYRFPGFYIEKRTLREYSYPIAAHLLGYTGEVNVDEINNDHYYKPGDYIGKSGIERIYERSLRGKKGVNVYIVDVLGRVQGEYKEGNYNQKAIAGKNIKSTIDIKLQAYGEKLLQNKIGAIVAIEPSTGEILSLVTGPGYKPDLFVGKKLAENYSQVENEEGKPLFNRALRSMQPPGSTFKIVNALIALDMEVITPRTVFVTSGYDAGTHIVRDHIFGAVTFEKSIQYSSNAYFCNVYKRMLSNKYFENSAEGYENWKTYVESFGLGMNLGTDLDFEKKGILYSSSYYNKYYGKGRWNYNTVISLAIGQGELGFTPLQTANMTAAVANRGYYLTPHVVKEIEGEEIDEKFLKRNYTKVNEKFYKPVINAMEKVVSSGTALSAYTPGIKICGKTGTAQNPHGDNHSIFVAFAPKDDPKIAISVFVENAGSGSMWAAPIASLMIEKYLTDSISKPWLEQIIINKSFIKKSK